MAASDQSAELNSAIEAAKQQPDDASNWQRVEELVETAQRPTDVSELFKSVIQQDSLSPELASDIGQRAVRFYESWYGEDSQELPKLLERVLDIDPSAGWAFERLTVAYTVAERWDELLNAYDRAIDGSDDAQRKMQLLDEAAQAAKDFVGDHDRAIDYMNELFTLDPSNTSLGASLERLLERQERWKDLITLWHARLELLPPKQTRDTRIKMADCYVERFSDYGSALEQVKRVLADAPEFKPAFEQLDTILQAQGASAEQRQTALTALKAFHVQRKQPEQVVRVLEAGLSFVPTDERRALLRELVERSLDLGSDERAMTHQAALVVLEPMPAERDGLHNLAERTRDYQGYVDALVAAANACEQPPIAAELLLEAARTRREDLSDPAAAIELYQRVFAGEGNPDTTLSAGRQLVKLLEETDRQQETLDVLVQLSESEADETARRDLLGRVARLAEKLGDSDRAQRAWQSRVGEDLSDVEALDALVNAAAAAEDWPQLADHLRQRIQAPGAADRRRADLVWLATIHADKLDELDPAISARREVLSQFGEDSESVSALTDLLVRAERWEELADVLNQAAGHEVARFTELQIRLGDAYRQHLGKPELAAKRYRSALQVDPSQEGARLGQRALLQDPACKAIAVESLTDAYTQTDEWENTLELLEPRIEIEEAATARAEILIEAADLFEERRNDRAAALSCLKRAFALIPDDRGTEKEIHRLAEQLGAWQVVVEAYRDTIAMFETPTPRAAELRSFEAKVLEAHLQDPRGALEAYVQAAEIAPDRVEFADAVVRLAGGLGRLDTGVATVLSCLVARGSLERGLLDTLESAAADHDGWEHMLPLFATELDTRADELKADVRRDVYVRLGGWQRSQLGDSSASMASLSKAAAADVSHGPTLHALAEMQRADPNLSLVDTLEKIADVEPTSLDALHEAAKVCAELSDTAASMRVMQRLYDAAAAFYKRDEEPTGEISADESLPWAMEHVTRLHMEGKAFRRAVDHQLDSAALPFAPEASQALRHQAAQTAVEGLEDPVRAIEIYRDILQIDPADRTAIAHLGDLYESADRLPELLMLRQHELGLDIEPDRRLALRLDASRILGVMESRGGRVESLIQNLEERAGHAESIEAVSKLLTDRGRHAELAALLAEQARRVTREGQVDQAIALCRQSAEMFEKQAGDIDAAISAYTELTELDPAGDASRELARLHTARGDHVKAAKWLEVRLRTAPPDARAVTAVDLSRAHMESNHPDRARAALQEALEHDPTIIEARDLLAQLYRGDEQWSLLAALLADGADHVSDARLRMRYLREAAQLHFHKLGSPELAIPALERAVALTPDDQAMSAMLVEGYRSAQRFDDARTLLSRAIEAFGRRRSPERAEMHYQLALVEEAAGNSDAAFEELEAASKMDLAHAGALHALARLARSVGDMDRAERAYRGLLMLVRRHQPTDIDAVGPAQVFFELYRIADERGQEEQARELIESALEAAAQSDSEARRFQRVLLARGDTDLLMRVLDARLDLAHDPVAEAEILSTKADVLVDPLGQDEEALVLRLKAVGLDPESEALHESTQALAAKMGAVQRYLDTLSSLAEKVARKKSKKSKTLVSRLTLRRGAVIEQDLKDFNRAQALYAEVESSGECVIEAWLSMARVAGARGDKAEQRRVLARIVELEDTEITQSERDDGYFQLAELELASEDTRDDGVASLTQALGTSPDYDRAKPILRDAVKQDGDHAGLLSLFERVARESQDELMLLEWFEHGAARPDARVDGFREGVNLAMRIEEAARAEALLEKAAELVRDGQRDASGVTWIFSNLADFKGRASDIPGAIAHLREAMEHGDGEERTRLTRQLAELAAAEGGDVEVAISAYEELLQGDPNDREVWEPALEVYKTVGDRSRFEDFVGRCAANLSLAEDRAFLRMEHARFLIDQAGSETEAIPVLQGLLAEAPGHIEATDLLTGIFQRNGMNDELADLLTAQFDAARDAQDGEAVAELGLRLGDLYSAERDADAIDAYRAALEWSPDHHGLLTALLGRLGDEVDTRERAEIMQRILKSETGDPAASLALELLEIWTELLDDERALEALELGYAGCPENKKVRQALEALYEERELWAPLSQLMRKEAARLGEGPVAVAQLKKAVEIYRDRLSDLEGAAECLRQALQIVPDDLALLGELARNLAAAGQSEQAVEDVNRLLDGHAEADTGRAELLLVRADLHLGIEKIVEAVEDLEEAYQIDVEKVGEQLIDALERLKTRAFTEGDQAAERESAVRRVQVLDELGRTEEAREGLAEWVEQDPSDLASLRALRDRDASAGRWEDVANTCERLIDAEQGDERAAAAIALASACEQIGRPEDARMGLERVHAQDPERGDVRDRLRALYERIGAHGELAKILEGEAALVEDPVDKASLFKRIADLYLKVGDADMALNVTNQALELQPDDKDLMLLVVDGYTKLGRLDEARTMLEESIGAHKRRRSPELALLQLRMARICAMGGDQDAQIGWLGQALDTDRKSGEIASELAEAAMEQSNYDVAMKALRSVTMMEDPQPMSRAVAFLRQAQIAEIRGDARRAQHWARKAKMLDEDLAEADEFLQRLGG